MFDVIKSTFSANTEKKTIKIANIHSKENLFFYFCGFLHSHDDHCFFARLFEWAHIIHCLQKIFTYIKILFKMNLLWSIWSSFLKMRRQVLKLQFRRIIWVKPFLKNPNKTQIKHIQISSHYRFSLEFFFHFHNIFISLNQCFAFK